VRLRLDTKPKLLSMVLFRVGATGVGSATTTTQAEMIAEAIRDAAPVMAVETRVTVAGLEAAGQVVDPMLSCLGLLHTK
jgi:hypothetical protein